MDFPVKTIRDTLAGQGVTQLYHANTILTASQYLRSGALISRGCAERRGLQQTPQSSDTIDKRYSIWHDVFLDSVDIHARAGRRNKYGPVLLEFEMGLLTNAGGKLWVTKTNPTKWKDGVRQGRWFTSISELKADFRRGDFDHMIVLRHCGGEVPFEGHLKTILLDDPAMLGLNKADLFSVAWGALRLAQTLGNLDVKIGRRSCDTECKCRSAYAKDRAMAKLMFSPTP